MLSKRGAVINFLHSYPFPGFFPVEVLRAALKNTSMNHSSATAKLSSAPFPIGLFLSCRPLPHSLTLSLPLHISDSALSSLPFSAVKLFTSLRFLVFLRSV